MTLVSQQHGVSAADDGHDRAAIYRQVVQLSELIVDGYISEGVVPPFNK